MFTSLLNLVPFAFDFFLSQRDIIETEFFFFPSLKRQFKPAIETRALDLCGKLDRNQKCLWALRDGLSMCLKQNLLVVEIEIDAKVVFDWISKPYNDNLNQANLIMNRRNLLSQIPQVKMKHCICEANQCTNAMTRK